MKKIIPICIVGILFCTTFGAVGLPTNNPLTNDNTIGRLDYTHTIFVQVGTATWCPSCPASNSAWHTIYGTGSYDFEYVEMVIDKSTVANTYMNSVYNLYWVPTSYFDGGQFVYPGTNTGTFQTNLNTCGARIVPDLDAHLNVLWLGSAQIQVDLSIINNDTASYTGTLRVYILELESRWKDYGGNTYHHAFLDFAFNKAITIPAGATHSDSTIWDGTAHGYADISSENIQVICVVFNDTQHQAYSDPNDDDHDGDLGPFWAYYVDETIAATPQSNSAPVQPNPPSGPTNGVVNAEYTYTGSTTDPNGDDIYYLFDWGDGSDSGWLGPYPSGTIVNASHTWVYGGTYAVKLKAKDATIDGPWSSPLTVMINGPDIELQNIKGGLFRIKAEIKNTWIEPVSNVKWNISLRSGVLIGKQTLGQNLTIPANSSVTIQSGLILGFGVTHIKIEAYIPDGPSAMVQKTAAIYLFFIKVSG